MTLAGRNFLYPLPPSLPWKSGNVNWKSKVTVGVYNVSVKNEEICGLVRWTSPLTVGWEEHYHGEKLGEKIVRGLDLGAGGAVVRFKKNKKNMLCMSESS